MRLSFVLLLLVETVGVRGSAAFFVVGSGQPTSTDAVQSQWRASSGSTRAATSASQAIRTSFSGVRSWTPTKTVATKNSKFAAYSPSTLYSLTRLSMGLTLYGHPGTRSPLVNWACYELGIDFAMGDLAQNPHPFGQLPCLTDDNDGEGAGPPAVVFESGAILQYLHRLYAESSQGTDAAPLTKRQIASVVSWITWANASLDPICFKETPQGKVYDTGLRDPNQRRLKQLDELLSQHDYLVDDTFSLADVAVASYLLYTVQFFPDVDLTPWPHLTHYMHRCASRDAYPRAFGNRVQSFLLERLQKSVSSA